MQRGGRAGQVAAALALATGSVVGSVVTSGSAHAGGDCAGKPVAQRVAALLVEVADPLEPAEDSSPVPAESTTTANPDEQGEGEGVIEDPEPADLSIEASSSPLEVEQDEVVTLTITIHNAGPGDEPAVTVSQAIPAGAVLTEPVESLNPDTGNLDLGSLAAGESVTVTISMVLPDTTGVVQTTPVVHGETSDAFPIDDQACTVVSVSPTPDDGSTPSAPGGEQPGPTPDGTETTAEPTPPTSSTQALPPVPGPGQSASGSPPTTGASSPPPATPGPAGDDGDDGTAGGEQTAGPASGAARGEESNESTVGAGPAGTALMSDRDAVVEVLGWLLLAAGGTFMMVGGWRYRRLWT